MYADYPNILRVIGCSIFACLLFLSGQVTAEKKPSSTAQEKVVSGWVEAIKVENFINPVKAKFDTGAKTSSIHAVNIKQYKKQGKRWVSFELSLPNADGTSSLLKMDKPIVRNVKIKNHEGDPDTRPVIKLNICFNNKIYETQFNLVDRSRYIYPVLIGRRFLAKNVIVDSAQTFLTLPECVSNTE